MDCNNFVGDTWMCCRIHYPTVAKSIPTLPRSAEVIEVSDAQSYSVSGREKQKE